MLEVRGASGEILYRNQQLGNRNLGGDPTPTEGVDTFSEREITIEGGTRVLMVSRRLLLEGIPVLIRIAYSTEPLHSQYQSQLFALLMPLPFVLAAAGFIGYYLAGNALKPIREMSRRAGEITSDRLHDRLPVNETDGELADLARIFNAMLSRLEQSFEQLRRFTSDASHELRTPLTLLKSVGEVGLQTNSSPEQYRDTIGSMLEDANRLTELVENLLTISRADAGQLAISPTSFAAMDLARESGDLLDVLLEEKEQQLEISGDETVMLKADWLLLRQALVNILHNAIKNTPVQGTIGIFVKRAESGVDIEVHDSGPGIDPEHRERVFDRFYRVDSGRSSAQGGTGLGLSIAQWTVRAHGGDITVTSNGSTGAVFQIHLPATTA
jgi:heavy metal sensor kinase